MSKDSKISIKSMKARVINDYYAGGCNVGDVVTIISGMEVDAQSVYNAPLGMCYLCRCENNKHTYILATSLEIIDTSPEIDWEQRRYEIAKGILFSLIAKGEAVPNSEMDYIIYKTNSFIEVLKKTPYENNQV